MTAKKTPAKKAPAKRKPRAKKPVDISAEFGEITTADLKRAAAELRKKKSVETVVETTSSLPWKTHAKNIAFGVVLLAAGAAGGYWSAGGVEITPVHDDVLQSSYDRDRVTQVAVLRELAAQPFDGETDDGRQAAGEWYNANRFKNRGEDYVPFTDAVAESIAANSEAELAKKLEAK